MNDAVKQTLLARVYEIAEETPLESARHTSSIYGTNIYIKREDLQPVHSFKLRGAYNKMAQLSESETRKGIIAASAGNHAQGVALSAQKLGINAQIVMPKTTPSIKVDAVKNYGAEVVLYGDNYSEAAEYSKHLVTKSGKVFIHPFDDPLVVAGQGTIGREILEQLTHVTHIFVPVGGGGLIAGIAQYVKQLRPEIVIIGVEPEDSNAMQASLHANKLITLPHVGIFADGVAVKQVGKLTFELAKKYVDKVITVSTDEICAAIKTIFHETRSIAEPAGALGMAGIMSYPPIHNDDTVHAVAICSGANMTFERLQFVAERTLVGSKKEALFAVTLPEKPGALEQFCKEVVNGHNITEFSYRLDERKEAHIFVGVSVQDDMDKQLFIERMSDTYRHADLSDDDLAKEHIRHMIGGTSKSVHNEHLYEINLPERSGALADFLAAIGSNWNISLFHSRGHGFDTVKVLVGFEATNPAALEKAIKKSGYIYNKATSKALAMFIS